ncbi:PKD domain-containing protein [Candidatus Pristimantibacillus sp. PTI5]|uniref:PKD domain-containing protein n=1 Tax=Candidatus Pristimantibacillus sp. PTI5 TaxID=3400422 RepID=UPI003B028EA1
MKGLRKPGKYANPKLSSALKWSLSLAMFSTLLMPGLTAFAEKLSPVCAEQQSGGPVWINAECVDPLYNRPVIDSETDLSTPVPHRKVSGHFEGTDKKFTFYFPTKREWKGRFFHLVYPLQDENATDVSISFGADSGAYTVQTNGGGGYRVDAAAAKFSKVVAAEYYGSWRRIFGYIYGGSGGSFQTIGAIENSKGVWDGAVPYITGVPTSIPNNFFARAFARFVLEDKAQQIADTVSPGGSGNPYDGLDAVERSVLHEVTKLGVPLRAWEDYKYVLGINEEGLLGFGGVLRGIDPTYVDDFWSKQGYLGTEQSALGEMFRQAKIDHVAAISEVTRDAHNVPTSLTIESVPKVEAPFLLESALYDTDGTTKIGTLRGSFDPVTKVFTIRGSNSESVLGAIEEGAKLRIDNRFNLAILSYHRHQVPKRPGYYAWDQFKAADGTPLYPQRPMEIGSLISKNVTGGGTYNGMINGKVIMVVNLLDADAYPWDGDWYSSRVKESLDKSYQDNFRLWYNDNADHISPGRTARLVQYDGILQQAIRDVSAWAEKGITPARSTRYELVDGQIKVPNHAVARGGIQPVVDLSVDGAARIDIDAGQTVTFKAKIQVPPWGGRVVKTEWDYLGTGEFESLSFGNISKKKVEVTVQYTYSKPGTYFPALRVTSEREGDKNTPFANVQNLGRVRVVVH